jgi:hypothetical protein
MLHHSNAAPTSNRSLATANPKLILSVKVRRTTDDRDKITNPKLMAITAEPGRYGK